MVDIRRHRLRKDLSLLDLLSTMHGGHVRKTVNHCRCFLPLYALRLCRKDPVVLVNLKLQILLHLPPQLVDVLTQLPSLFRKGLLQFLGLSPFIFEDDLS